MPVVPSRTIVTMKPLEDLQVYQESRVSSAPDDKASLTSVRGQLESELNCIYTQLARFDRTLTSWRHLQQSQPRSTDETHYHWIGSEIDGERRPESLKLLSSPHRFVSPRAVARVARSSPLLGHNMGGIARVHRFVYPTPRDQ